MTRRKTVGFDVTGILLQESGKLCKRVGLHKDLVPQILNTDTDWAFILKVDALLETAAKHIRLQVRLLTQVFKGEKLDDFIDSLSINGRTSVLSILEASGLPDEQLRFIEITRLVRNAYAHNIKYADTRLIDQLICSIDGFYERRDIVAVERRVIIGKVPRMPSIVIVGCWTMRLRTRCSWYSLVFGDSSGMEQSGGVVK
jgi:hypothetical protein